MRMPTLYALAAMLAAGCAARNDVAPQPGSPLDDFTRELPPGELGLSPLPPGAPLPDFSIAWNDRARLAESVRHSLDYLGAPSSQKHFPYGEITHERMVASLERFLELLETSTGADQFRASMVAEFEVWMARGRSNTGDVLFTGYCRPILRGARERGGAYQYPLYGAPDDLVKGEDGAILGRRTEGDDVVPYYTTSELLQNRHLDGKEIVWLDDPFDAYIAQVQGSALIQLPDGSMMEVGYAGKNGHEYRSIGMILVDEGRIARSQLSLATLRDYFRKNPSEVDRVIPMNPSFVFFQPTTGGPYGSLGQAVTDMRTLATDKDIFPRGGLCYVEVRLPAYDAQERLIQRPMRFFASDQDRGGAIKSAGRSDVFIGTGDAATARAGHVLSIGRLYYLFLKAERVPVG
ncbi:MAG: murein transglycosylase [Planctomycetota bacterium]|nr:MAG: murein transglycosylase [Planctomycetota bacterium]